MQQEKHFDFRIRIMDQALSIDLLRRRSRLRLAAGALLCAAIAAALWGLNRLVRPSIASSDVTISEVRIGSVDNTIAASGVVVPVHEEVLSSPGASRVAHVHAKPGQQVKAGDLLLELDDREIRLALESLQEQLAQQDNRILTLGQDMDQKIKQTKSAIELLEIDLQA
ncbi:MAG TPA: biotin/lipoyl-binding protein, partial [Telluria sp.]